MKSCEHSEGYTDAGQVRCDIHGTVELQQCGGCQSFQLRQGIGVERVTSRPVQGELKSKCTPCEKKGKPVYERDWMELL